MHLAGTLCICAILVQKSLWKCLQMLKVPLLEDTNADSTHLYEEEHWYIFITNILVNKVSCILNGNVNTKGQ
jgi:hypothetical protein